MDLSREAFREKVREGNTMFGKEQNSHSGLRVGV